MHLKQPGFAYWTCGPFTKNKERIQKFKETGYTKYICRNELDEAWFQDHIGYGDFKDLARRTNFDKVLRDKALNIAKNPKYDGYQRGLAYMIYKFFDKKSAGSGITTFANKFATKNQITQNRLKDYTNQLLENFKKNSAFKDNIWGAYLPDMQLISKFSKGIRFLLCIIDIYSNLFGLFFSKIEKV